MTSLIAALLLTQAVQVENWINWTSYRTFGASQVRVPLRLPLSATGPLLTEDAGTVSHVYWTPVVTNYALQSGSMCTSPWGISGGTCTPNAATAPDSTNTMVNFTSSDPEQSVEYMYQFATTASSTQFTASVWAAKTGGTGTTSVQLDFSANASGCACGGSACTVIAFGTMCQAKFTGISTTPVRVWVSGTGAAARTNPSIFIFPGEYAVTGGTSLLWGGQIEAGTLTPGTYTPTTTTTASSGGLTDTLPNAWIQNGTVPQTQANVSPFVPGKAGAGPYSAANSYQGPTTLGEWTGDWSVTVVFKPSSIPGANSYLVGKSNAGTTVGWGGGFTSGGVAAVFVYDTAGRIPVTTNPVTVGGINVATYGKSGGTCYVRLNGGAAGSIACGTMASGAAEAIRIGELAADTLVSTTTTIYEILASTTPYSDALHAARFNAVFGHLPGPVSVTRADPLTYTANGFVWSAPPAAMAISAQGAEVWKGSTNSILQSSTSCVANAISASWPISANVTCTSDTDTAPNGTTTMDSFTTTTVAGYLGQTATVASGTTFVGSVYMSKPSTGTATLLLDCASGTTSGCACGTSDGSACTPSGSVARCTAKFTDVGTTTIRGWASHTCSVANTGQVFYMVPGEVSVSTGTTRFWGAQVEPGLYPTPYIATAGTATARAATVASVPLPALGNKWCVSVTATPGQPWASRSTGYAWSTFAGSPANVALLSLSSTAASGFVYGPGGEALAATYSHGFTGADPHRFTVCTSNAQIRLYVDGVLRASAAGLAQTATLTPLGIGGNANGGTYFDGSITNLKVCRMATKASECP